MQPPPDDFDPIAAQKEAALFYGLYLRGHKAERLRRDIEIPVETFEKWLQHRGYEGPFRDAARRTFEYRRQVLAVFDELVGQARVRARVQ
jgi:hypothetical protein